MANRYIGISFPTWRLQDSHQHRFMLDSEQFKVNMYMFTITRFFVAIFLNGLYVATFTYSMELMNSKFRTFTGVNIQAQFAVGYIILGFLRAVEQMNMNFIQAYTLC